MLTHTGRRRGMAYNILIVDDSAIVRAVIERTVRLCGVDVGEIHEAANGREALSCLQDTWVDIIFADINMPVMNGIELIEELDRQGTLKETPVVVVTTDRSEVRIQQLKAHGIREYLNKPFTPEQIRDVLERCLEKK